MAQQIIAEHANVESVTYALPNKHYIPVDMKYIGVDNLTPLSFKPFSHSLPLPAEPDSSYHACWGL